MYIESRVMSEGSVSGLLNGRRYNRAVCFHKLSYGALLSLVNICITKTRCTQFKVREIKLSG